MNQLEIQNLSVSYGGIKALRSIRMILPRGELVSLIGANGAGKSTLLNAICGVVKAESGKIIFEGDEITNRKPHWIVKRGISQVPEGRRIFSKLTVEENLKMGAFIRPSGTELRRDMEMVFHLFPKLKERQYQVAGTLSGGEQQMLAIGRALMSRPKLLLLDEPSMGLAPVLVDLIMDTIRRIHDQGTGILLVEQNAYAALEISNRAYVIQTGNIIIEGKSSELLNMEEVQRVYLAIS